MPLTAVIQLSRNLGKNEMWRWFYISFISSAKSLDCILVNLSVRRTMGKNWLRSVMAIIGSTLEYNRAGVYSHMCLEMDPS